MSDQKWNIQTGDSKEAVAFALMQTVIYASEPSIGFLSKEKIFALYEECLAVVMKQGKEKSLKRSPARIG